jgi:D-hydroxyproline dehydrogenase subunit gamma
MFRRLHEGQNSATIQDALTIFVNGQEVRAQAGDTVAAALLLAGHIVFRRTIRSGQARGPYCAMGTCFECLVSIDGQPSQQACLMPVRAGMVVESTDMPVLAP